MLMIISSMVLKNESDKLPDVQHQISLEHHQLDLEQLQFLALGPYLNLDFLIVYQMVFFPNTKYFFEKSIDSIK